MRGAYLFRLNRDPPATAAKIKPAAPSASMRIVSMGIPIASCANQPKQQRCRCRSNQGEKEFDRPPHASTIAWSHNDPFGSPLFLDPQCYPHCIAAAVQTGFFLATRQLSGIITFRSIAFGPPSERDRQGQVGRVPKPLPASRRAKRILVPAAVAAAENVRGGLAQARPSGFLHLPARSVAWRQACPRPPLASMSSRSACNRSTLRSTHFHANSGLSEAC